MARSRAGAGNLLLHHQYCRTPLERCDWVFVEALRSGAASDNFRRIGYSRRIDVDDVQKATDDGSTTKDTTAAQRNLKVISFVILCVLVVKESMTEC